MVQGTRSMEKHCQIAGSMMGNALNEGKCRPQLRQLPQNTPNGRCHWHRARNSGVGLSWEEQTQPQGCSEPDGQRAEPWSSRISAFSHYPEPAEQPLWECFSIFPTPSSPGDVIPAAQVILAACNTWESFHGSSGCCPGSPCAQVSS